MAKDDPSRSYALFESKEQAGESDAAIQEDSSLIRCGLPRKKTKESGDRGAGLQQLRYFPLHRLELVES
jgi:hypothetical protein